VHSNQTLAIAALVIVLFLSQSQLVRELSQPPGGDWTNFTYDYSDSRYNSLSTLNYSNVSHLVKRWTISSGYAVTGSPMVLNGMVYFGDWGGNVYSANISTGVVKWEVNLGAAISSTFDLANGFVYVALSPHGPPEVIALNQSTGAIIWKDRVNTSMSSIWASPIVYNGKLYIGMADGADETNTSEKGEIDAFNAATGAFLWRFKTITGSCGGSSVWGSVVVDTQLNSIYFGTGNVFGNCSSALYSYSIISLDATSGSLNWYFQAYKSAASGHDLDFGSTPNLFSYYAHGKDQVQALGLGGKDGIYYILDRGRGKLLQEVPIANPGNGHGIFGLAGFIYPDGSGVNPEIFIPAGTNINKTCCGEVAAYFPQNQSFAWKYLTPGPVLYGSVAVVPGAVLVGDGGGNLYALSTVNGKPIFHAKLSPIYGGVTVAEGYVLVGQGKPGAISGPSLIAFSPSL
jgi:outer membrane protein assembly factor BamB